MRLNPITAASCVCAFRDCHSNFWRGPLYFGRVTSSCGAFSGALTN